MQEEFYTSCIKINGIPLLPPLMTADIKEEMRRYRSLAVKVEENLRNRRLVKRVIQDKCVQADIKEPIDKLKSIRYSSDSDVSSRDNITSDTNNSDSQSKMTVVEPMMKNADETRDGQDIQSSISDTQSSQLQVSSTNDSTEPIAAIIDQNKYANVVEDAISNEDTALAENWKPEVPKTLDIVPIMLTNDEEATPSSTEASKKLESPPKLSRQGSYVLDTPSPMLLAHMHTELVDYVPTQTANVQRKQWNIVQSKVEWENKQFMAEDVEASDKLECTPKKLISQHRQSNSLTELHQTNKSNSNKAVIIEKDRSDAASSKHNRRSSTDLRNQSFIEKSEKGNSSLNSSRRGYTEDTNSPKVPLSCADERQYKKESVKESHEPNIKKTKSSTPDKLLTIYKEIEEMHKKQMMELIYRQRKEQSQLQAEFQKQQMLVLAEIRRCASGTPRQTNRSNALSRSSSNDDTRPTGYEMRQQSNINSPTQMTRAHNKLANRVIMCPLDYLSSQNLYLLKHQSEDSPTALDSDFARKVSLYDVAYNNNNNHDNNGNDGDNSSCESRDVVVHKNPNVSRQLFPLNSNTMHVPVLDTVYLDKHIRAANIINAYARGYLVRRLMRTECVITLKKVYKEALQCMLKLHVDAPLNSAEVDFLHRLQLQCDAASMNIVELFAQSPAKRMKVIAQDREIKQSRTERPTSARSYSFATQKTLARKNLKEFESTMAKYQRPLIVKKNLARSRCQTWTSDMRDRLVSPNTLHQGIRRSTSTGAVRKPWR